MYRDDCDECTRGCKHYYQCGSCDYYMDDDMKNDNIYFIVSEPKDKPIKLVVENNIKMTTNGNVIEIKKHLSTTEVKKLLNDIFGSTNIGVLDCDGMSDEEVERMVNM